MSEVSSKELDDIGDALSRWFESQDIDTALGTLAMLRLIAKLVVRKDPDSMAIASGANVVMRVMVNEFGMLTQGK